MSQHDYMSSGLDRELELYMGAEYENELKPYDWTDDGGISRQTILEIFDDQTDSGTYRTGSIAVPEHIVLDDDENQVTVAAATTKFVNIEKSSDGTRLYGNPKRFEQRSWVVRITIVSAEENSKIQVDTKSLIGDWKSNQTTKIKQVTADFLIAWVKDMKIPIRTRNLEMEYEKIGHDERRDIDIEQLQEGDIIVSTTRHPLSAAIRLLSGAQVSHAALYIGNAEVVEALGGGVQRHSVVKAIKDDKHAYVLRYPNLSQGAKGIVTDFAIQHANLNTPFDVWGMVFRAGLRIPGGGEDRFYCSELVLNSYKTAGISLFETTQKRPSDIDELRGTLLSYEGHLKMTRRQRRKATNLEFEAWERGIDDDDELDNEYQNEFEFDEFEYESDFDDEYEDEFQDESESEFDELEEEGVTEYFARELYEMSLQAYESEYELEMELDDALDAMENEFMVKRIRRNRNRGKKRKGIFKKILKVGGKILGGVVSKTPIGSLVKAGTSLVSGDVKGALGGLAKAAMGTTLGPVSGTIATSAIDAVSGDDEIRGRKRRAMRKIARVARDTYREVADNLPEDFDDPVTANEVAKRAVKKAMIKNTVQSPRNISASLENKRIVRLKPGQKLVIVG